MAKQSFLLVSLKEDKAKELAQVISNESCRKILDYLSEKQDATETELAQKLNVPISTVHYNLQHLMKAGIITAEEFHYSKKGKEVNHYKLANKYIIIAPKTTFGIKQKLKNILPVIGLSVAAAWFVNLFTNYFYKQPVVAAKMMAEQITEAPLMEAARQVPTEGVYEAGTVAPFTSNIALWFFIGAIFAIVIYLISDYLRKK